MKEQVGQLSNKFCNVDLAFIIPPPKQNLGSYMGITLSTLFFLSVWLKSFESYYKLMPGQNSHILGVVDIIHGKQVYVFLDRLFSVN